MESVHSHLTKHSVALVAFAQMHLNMFILFNILVQNYFFWFVKLQDFLKKIGTKSFFFRISDVINEHI